MGSFAVNCTKAECVRRQNDDLLWPKIQMMPPYLPSVFPGWVFRPGDLNLISVPTMVSDKAFHLHSILANISQYYFPVRNTGRHFHPKRKALKLFWNKASFTKFFKPVFFSQWKQEFNCILGDIATNFPYILKMPLKAPYIMTYLYFLCVKKNDVMYPTDSQSIR